MFIALLLSLSAVCALSAASLAAVGCSLNGTMFGEGSAMVTSSHCEYCYCIKGRQHCVRPQCLLDVTGCTPQYSEHSCCPVKYNCSDLRNSTVTSTTIKPSETTIDSGSSDCQVNGTKYLEGERVESTEEQCENCYCVQSQVRCKPIVCQVPLQQCYPVTSPGHCCPTSYDCSDLSKGITESTTNEGEEKTTTENLSTTIMQDTTIETDNTNNETTTVVEVETTNDLLTLQLNDNEQRSVTESSTVSENPSTALLNLEEPTTVILETTIATATNVSSPVRSSPDVIEAIINRTLAKDDDYEYDYEQSLPPSLPNLKIIPFVAADAVVSEEDMKSKTDEPIYFDYPQPSRFSPPKKTEGGFLPRDPIIDGPFYETKFDKPFINSNSDQIERASDSLQLPPITEPPKLFDEVKCIYNEKTYHHGEVVSEPNACELCVCYYGQSYCQKPKCSPVKEGCRRIMHDNDSSCCGRVLCDNMQTKIIDNLESSTLSTLLPESMSNIPAITVADLVVTPDPFKDVIRTEPAPDLSDIIKDMLPHLKNESSTTKPLTSMSRYPLENSALTDTANSNGTQNNVTQNIDVLKVNNATNVYGNIPGNGHTKNSTTFHEEDDSFSFDSVLDLLFPTKTEMPASKPPLATTKVPLTSTKMPLTTNKAPLTTSPRTSVYNNLYSHHLGNQKQEINNAIEIADVDYIGQKERIPEKSSDYSVVNDYQADESKNYTKENLDSDKNKGGSNRTDSIKETLKGSNKANKAGPSSGMQLKLAGCNIYGRMYEIGRIISELSGPCLECMCTEFGVQCRKVC